MKHNVLRVEIKSVTLLQKNRLHFIYLKYCIDKLKIRLSLFKLQNNPREYSLRNITHCKPHPCHNSATIVSKWMIYFLIEGEHKDEPSAPFTRVLFARNRPLFAVTAEHVP